MKKIPTLFVRNPENMKLVTREVNPECEWLFNEPSFATIKKDGTNIQVIVHDGKCINVNKRRNPTREQKALGDEPGYIQADRNDSADQYIFAAVDATDFSNWPNGDWSCEALGPKIQGGIESNVPELYPFSLYSTVIIDFSNIENITYDYIQKYLEDHEIEGIVWREAAEENPRFAKIKRRDFGLQWPVKK
jgi:hypothetical protein